MNKHRALVLGATLLFPLLSGAQPPIQKFWALNGSGCNPFIVYAPNVRTIENSHVSFSKVIGDGTVIISPNINFIFGCNNATGANFTGIINGTSGNIVKIGTGTQVLSGVNTYTGTTIVSDGTLQVGNGGTAGSIAASSAIINNGTIAYNLSNNYTETHGISGAGSLLQMASTLLLTGNNTYTGSTTINTGSTIQLGQCNATLSLLGGGNYTGNIINNGSLILNTTTNQTLAGRITGTGSITKNCTNTLIYNNSNDLNYSTNLYNSYSGGTTINGGTIQLHATNGGGLFTARTTSGGTWLNSASKFTLGFRFTPTQDLLVYQLAVNCQNATLGYASFVGIWTDTGALLGSVTVSAGTAKINGYAYTTLATPIQLYAGTFYRIGANVSGNQNAYNLNITATNNKINSVDAYYASGVWNTFPNTYTSVNYGTANFIAIPWTHALGTGAVTLNTGTTLNKNGYDISNTMVNNGGTVNP
jgi:autotransporter-associated beta strand protein